MGRGRGCPYALFILAPMLCSFWRKIVEFLQGMRDFCENEALLRGGARKAVDFSLLGTRKGGGSLRFSGIVFLLRRNRKREFCEIVFWSVEIGRSRFFAVFRKSFFCSVEIGKSRVPFLAAPPLSRVLNPPLRCGGAELLFSLKGALGSKSLKTIELRHYLICKE